MSGNPTALRSFPALPGTRAPGPAQKLRICIASCEFIGPIRNGGIGTAYTAMAHALAGAGHDVTLLYTQGSQCENKSIAHWEKFYRESGLRFVARPANPGLRIDAPPHAVRSYETYQWLKSQAFDLVHFPEWGGDAYYSLLARHQGLAFDRTLFCIGTHSPTAWLKEANSEYFAQPRELELDFMERRSVALADVVVSPCQYMLGWMAEHGFDLPARCHVQQNLLPASARATAPVHNRGAGQPITELVFFGRLETRKGLELFCNALDEVKTEPDFKDLRICFMGKPATVHGRDSRAYLRLRAEAWKWEWQILSDLDQPAAMRYLREPGRMAVIPSLMENSPYTVLECLGSGIPFLASRVGGIPELITSSEVAAATFAPNPKYLAGLLRRSLKAGARPWTPAIDPEHNQAAWLAWHQSLEKAAPAAPTPNIAEQPLVSVCVPHFNRPKFLQQALDSLAAQNYPNFEVIVVDDGSTSPEAVEFLERIEPNLKARGWRLVRQENRYLSAARNTGARHARGEYLLFMDDDNFAKPHELSSFVTVARRTGADILTCGMDYFEGATPPAEDGKPVTRWIPLGPDPAAGYFRNCFGDANCLVRKDVFEKLGGFTEVYGVTHEDWEFLANAVLKGCSLEVIPDALFHYRFIADSMIRSTSQYRNHLRHIRPYLDLVPPALRPVLLVAQGAAIQQAKQQLGQNAAAAMVRWQSQFEAGRILVQLGHKDAARERFVAGIKAAESTGHAGIVLEALSAIGGELRFVDPAHARDALEIGLKLAEALKRTEAIQNFKSLISSIPDIQMPVSAPNSEPGAAASSPPKPEVAVSIVIPTFNRLDLTQPCLEAVRRNTPAELFELIVVDNASTDGTVEFLKAEHAAGRVTAILNEGNLGFARASNQGAAVARGRYVLFLNNDTEVQPGWLQPLVALADADPQVGAVGSKLLFPDGTLQHAGVVLLDDRVHGDPLMASHIFHHKPQDLPEANRPMMYQALTAACLLVRKGLFDELAGFDEQYRNGYEDVDLCFKIGQAGRHLVYQPASVVVHHESQSGPERFRHAPQNIQRLHQRWLNRIQADFICESSGLVAVEPRRIAAYLPPSPGKSLADSAAPCAVSIVILVLNQVEHTRRCLDSIAACTPLKHEVVVIDNGSTDGTPEFLPEWQQSHSNCIVVRNAENRGFAAGNNQGLSIASGAHVVLLNNDTIVTPGWLEGMLEVLHAHPTTGVVGPMSDNVSGPQQIATPGALAVSDPAAFGADWARQHGGQSFEITRAVGFCLLARRDVIDRIGGLDEQFGSGNFEDDDFCLRARLAGFGIRVAKGVFIRHVGGQTFKSAKIDYRQAMLRNWDLFRAKWQLPAEASLEKGYPVPARLPDGVPLRVSLPLLQNTHRQEDSRRWSPLNPMSIPPTDKSETPAVARFGNLDAARTLLGRRELAEAWQAALAALAARPFHPEAFLLLAEIALSAGDGDSARRCAQQAHRLAPGWKPAAQFLQRALKGNSKSNWLILPEALRNPGTEASPRLTVCVIARNEEQFLDQCLRSIVGLASQIIVIDTGSTDHTVDIAKRRGAEVYSFAWCDDFSAARNVALEHATGDWILMLDADEELPADQHDSWMTHVRHPTVMAYRLPLVNQGREAEGQSYVPRLFRNVPGAFYRGRIHEQVFPNLLALSKGWGLKTGLGTARLLHHGYTRDMVRDRNKIERNLRLLRQAIVENPGDVNLTMNLGLELTRSGDVPGGMAQYREAYRLMSALPPAAVVPELREALLTQFTSQLYKIRAHDEVVRVLTSALSKQVGGLNASLHFALGLSQFELKNYREAAAHMNQCLAKRGRAGLTPINTDVLTAAPRHCLALSLARLGDAAGAEKEFQKGLAESGRTDELAMDYARFLTEQKRPVEALQRLHELVMHASENATAWRLGGEIALSRTEFLDFASDWSGEALGHLPADPTLIAQRAEALMLKGQIAAARPLWEKACNGTRPPRALAAWILCSAVESGEVPTLPASTEETAVSRAFIDWYQKLLSVGARETVVNLNSHLGAFRPTLPTAAHLLDSALAEAAKQPA